MLILSECGRENTLLSHRAVDVLGQLHLETLPEPQEPIPAPRKAEDMLQEVLEIVRDFTKPLTRPQIFTSSFNPLTQALARIRSVQDRQTISPEERDETIESVKQSSKPIGQFIEELNQRRQFIEQYTQQIYQHKQFIEQSTQQLEQLNSLIMKLPPTQQRKKPTPKGRHTRQGKPQA